MANKYTHYKATDPGKYSARSWSETTRQGAYRLKAGREIDRRKEANHKTAEHMYGKAGTDNRVYGGVLNVAYSKANGTIVKTRRGGTQSVA